MKPLAPTLKEKKRYIGFEVITDKAIKPSSLEKAAKRALFNYLGDLGMAKSGAFIISNLTKKNKLVVRTELHYVNEIKAAMILANRVDNSRVIFKSVATSGCLNKVNNKLYGDAS